MKTLGLILAIILAIALTIAVCLGALALVTIGGVFVWDWARRLFFPSLHVAADAHVSLLKTASHYQRRRQAHDGPVFALAVSADGDHIVSAGRDKTLRLRNTQGDDEVVLPLPFFPGPLALGEHEDNGLRVAVGVFGRVGPDEEGDAENDADAPHIHVYEPSTGEDDPRFVLRVPGLRMLHILAWDEPARRLRALAAVFDPLRPLASNNDPASANRLVLLEYDLRDNPDYNAALLPVYLALPPHLDTLHSWEAEDTDGYALSENGRYLACRTTNAASEGAPETHGVGVWDVDAQAWAHRFGGLEAQPHDIWSVTRSGERVFSGRQDDPGRDYKFGGQEWYDGLYLWDAKTSPPEGVEVAFPVSGVYGGRELALTLDETRLANPSGASGAVDIYDLPRRLRVKTLQRPDPNDESKRGHHNVWRCAFVPGTSELVTGHYDGELWWWDISAPPPQGNDTPP